MTRAPHEVILASAGTGKTFRLARRYVQLLASGSDHGTILATTFTRKAAREILARVMQWLAKGAGGGEGFAELEHEVFPDGDAPPDWSPLRCRELLREVTRGLHRLQVRTLDSWFASLARLFGLELGLPAGWTLADARDDGRLRDAVLAALFDERGEQRIAALLSALQSGEFTRTVHSGQLDLLRGGLELLRDSGSEAWEHLDPGPKPDDDARDAAAEALRGVPLPTTQAGKPRRRWQTAVPAAAQQLADSAWRDFLKQTLVAKVLDGDPKYDGAEIGPEVETALREGVRIAGWHVLDELQRWTRAAHELLQDFDARYADAKHASGGYLHEDLPRLLVGGAEAHLDEAAVSYRSGSRLRHLLLDEFQDTSVWQWRVLEPLLERVLGADDDASGDPPSLFCVGDGKQSIYGWRQGEPRLLAGISAWYDLGEPESMAASYRSAQQILDAVNLVFGRLAEIQPQVPGMDAAAATAWAADWQDHVAELDLIGGVGAHLIAKDEDGITPMAATAAQQVAEIHARHPQAKVAILVRQRKRIPQLLHELENRGIRASGEGGSELTDSQAVQAALSAFRLADRPRDTMAAFHLAGGPFADAVGLDPEAAGSAAFPDAAMRASSRIRRRLLEDGAGRLLESLRESAAAQWEEDDWELRRYAQLIDLAHAFDRTRTLRPAAFVEHVEGTPLENPAPSTIRVMTIHASKGLEFDAVILPLWQEARGNRDLFVYSRPDPRRGCTQVLRRPTKELLAVDERLHALASETATREQHEALCVLYVAMTRAERQLVILLEEGARDPSTFTLPLLVQTALGVGEEGWGLVDPRVRRSPDSDSPTEPEPEPEPPVVPRPPPLSLAAASGSRSRPRWSPSGSESETSIDGGTLFLRGGDAARTRGTIMHRLFAEVEWLDGEDAFAETDVALSAILVHAGVGDGGSYQAALAEFRHALTRREVKQLLMRAGYREEGGLEVWRERSFAVAAPEPGGADTAILHGTFDRVVLVRDASGQPVRAHVVDYKTGTIADDAELADKTAAYRAQMEAYRTALCAMTGLAPADVRLSLLFVDAGRVAEL